MLQFTYFLGLPLMSIPSLIFGIAIFVAIYLLSRRSAQATQTPDMQPAVAAAYAAPERVIVDASNTQEGKLYDSIVEKMVGEKLFLREGFSIVELSEEVFSNRTYVSSCINKMAGQSYSEFVNSYRINYAVQLLTEDVNHETPIGEIGLLSGFTNQTSFIRNFKKFTGVTPSEWRS